MIFHLTAASAKLLGEVKKKKKKKKNKKNKKEALQSFGHELGSTSLNFYVVAVFFNNRK
jgi:hypothetical protein